jgi:hypothetical protein
MVRLPLPLLLLAKILGLTFADARPRRRGDRVLFAVRQLMAAKEGLPQS